MSRHAKHRAGLAAQVAENAASESTAPADRGSGPHDGQYDADAGAGMTPGQARAEEAHATEASAAGLSDRELGDDASGTTAGDHAGRRGETAMTAPHDQGPSVGNPSVGADPDAHPESDTGAPGPDALERESAEQESGAWKESPDRGDDQPTATRTDGFDETEEPERFLGDDATER